MEVAARARTVRLGKTQKGSPQVVVEFVVMSKGQFEHQTFLWFGNLTPSQVPGKVGALDITRKALVVMGWNGDASVLDSGAADQALPKKVRLSIEQNEDGYWNARNVFPLERTLVQQGREVLPHELGALQALLDGSAESAAPSREPGSDDLSDSDLPPPKRKR